MKHLEIPSRLETLRASIARLGGEVTTFRIDKPATLEQVEAVERQIGKVMPAPLRSFFVDVSAGIDVFWSLETPGRDFMGGFDLVLADVPLHWTNWTGWRDSFADPAAYGWPPEMNLDVYDAAFPLQPVLNGDQLILFYDDPGDPGEVMYLDHEMGDGDRVILGTSLERFLQTWVALGCPGPDWNDLADFYDFDAQELSVETDDAREWLHHLGAGG